MSILYPSCSVAGLAHPTGRHGQPDHQFCTGSAQEQDAHTLHIVVTEMVSPTRGEGSIRLLRLELGSQEVEKVGP